MLYAVAYGDLTRQRVKESPEYDREPPLDREHEVELPEHYQVEGYWQDEMV